MKAKKIVSLVLLVACTVVAVAAGLSVTWLPGLERTLAIPRHGLIIGAMVALVLAATVALAWFVGRSLALLKDSIERAATEGRPGTIRSPRWLQPITRAFTGLLDQFHKREQSLRTRLRDLEIRHRVSEAERARIEAVLHSLRDAVIVTDAFNEIVMANQAAAKVLQFALEDVIHQPVEQVVSDGRLCQLITDVRETGNFVERRHVEHELALAGPAGDAAPDDQGVYDVTLVCVENHRQEVGGVVTILHDLSRERELSQMKSDFVSKTSHELRTPLSSIQAYVEMLVDGEASDEEARHEFYRIIQNETERLGRLIDNMLNISRIEAGIVQIERENVDIKPLIIRATDTLEPQARERKISLLRKLAAVDLCVEGDADMLYQVVLNLVSNAVKYTPEGGRVTVSADSENLTRSVVVTVVDTGLGIPPDALPKLFDKFYRVENYKRVAKGTGLGLSLCKHIVEMVHHGQVGVESKLGMGSRFWFSIPMRYAGSYAAA